VEGGGVTVADVDEEVGFEAAIGEELGVDFGVIEAGHGAAVEAEGACGEDEVGAAESGVSVGVGAGEVLFGGIGEEVGEFGVLGEEFWDVLVEFLIVGNDGGDGGSHGFVDVAGHEEGFEAFLGLGGFKEDDAHGVGVGGGGAEFGEVVDFAEEGVRDGFGEPGVVGAGGAEEGVEAFGGDGGGHGGLLLWERFGEWYARDGAEASRWQFG